MRCLEEAEVALFFEGRLDSYQIDKLERHLEMCPSCLSLVAAVAPALASGPIDPGQTSLLRVGDVLAGRYRVEAILGAGATGYVYQARDQLVETVVALKVLRPRLADDPAWVRSFIEELQVARRIVHPNVCRVFDMQQTEGHSFLTMELASGGSLRDDIRRASIRPAAEKLADAVALTRGLAAIHAAGIAHRDVKPANVLRTEDGRILLSDFGLSRASLSLVPAPRPVGTPAYMAPEVASGEPATPLSDVWSLGVTLRELYFGEKADVRTTAEGRGKKLRDPMGRAMARLCADCLAIEPGDRPGGAAAVLQRLEALQDQRRLQRRRRTWRVAVAASALVAAGGAVAGARIFGWFRPSSTVAASESRAEVSRDDRAAVLSIFPARPGPDSWKLRLSTEWIDFDRQPAGRRNRQDASPRVARTAPDLALKGDPSYVTPTARARLLARDPRGSSPETVAGVSSAQLTALLAGESKLAQAAPEDASALAVRCRLLESAVATSDQPADALWSRALGLCRRAAQAPVAGVEALGSLARLQVRACEPAAAVRSYQRALKGPHDNRRELLAGWATLALRERWPHGGPVDGQNVGGGPLAASSRMRQGGHPPLELLIGALHLQQGDVHSAYMMLRSAVGRGSLSRVQTTALLEGLRRSGKAIKGLPRSERTKFDGTPESSDEELIERIRSAPREGLQVVEEIGWTAPARATRLLAALAAPQTCTEAIGHALVRRSVGALRPQDSALAGCNPNSQWVQRCKAHLQEPLGSGDPLTPKPR